MKEKDVVMNRRNFLKSSSGAAAAIGTAGVGITTSAYAETTGTSTTLTYPELPIGKSADMPLNTPLNFFYPDDSSPCVAIKLGNPVVGGVGPEEDIVAYSVLCTHMGCPVSYDGEDKVFKCGCHFSMFDAEKSGQMITGQATEDLPRIELAYDAATDTVRATGVDGLIYGRQANIL